MITWQLEQLLFSEPVLVFPAPLSPSHSPLHKEVELFINTSLLPTLIEQCPHINTLPIDCNFLLSAPSVWDRKQIILQVNNYLYAAIRSSSHPEQSLLLEPLIHQPSFPTFYLVHKGQKAKLLSTRTFPVGHNIDQGKWKAYSNNGSLQVKIQVPTTHQSSLH